ncbi:kinase-like protein [Pseudovirgaria hyperparasitica]|uniref:dual-specificity kinase n=1 Tax=Pseudovirgaria hyperparasitica TaxID=470096 RepID=A0A6A6W4I9_9PEZI|nr:kinase-like protein [Pseudovirgaria hyperparasitica]KAF2756954.1 kinase-like protein [Pseudovirgaria hyperparasitica]
MTSTKDKKTDWNEFYKNGIPKEVIVIDDSPEPQSSRTAVTNGNTRHADKKRKTATYEPLYHQQTSYSTTQTPYYDHTSPNTTATASSDRSAVATTATTSLGSNGTSAYMAPVATGQKRKRAPAKAEKPHKRREIDLNDPAPLALYRAPPKPPIKSAEVKVEVVQDIRHHPKDKVDDEDGHYIVIPDADLTQRYQIVRLLGQGTFGKVVEAYDRQERQKVAIKVIRSVQKYRDASRIELRVLKTLASNDQDNANRCIHLRHCFDFRNHICIVTDLYSQSVFDFLKANQFVPFPSTHIQKFAKQLFTSVAFLHDLNLIHTDLKPENILLVNNSYQTFTYNRQVPSSSTSTSRTSRHRRVLLDPEIRLIDFGSATFQEEYHSSVVSTRHYRAPEIILNLGWSFPCDIWSIGCILVEFFTGDALFQTHDNLEHLAMMEAVCGGKIDKDIIRAVQKSDKGSSRNPATSYFRGMKLDYPNGDTQKTSKKYVRAMKKLHDTIPCHTDFNRQFLDLLKKIFVYDPKKRIKAHEALHHRWFSEVLTDDGTEAHRIRLEKEKKAARQR